jgi:hypothetical protein
MPSSAPQQGRAGGLLSLLLPLLNPNKPYNLQVEEMEDAAGKTVKAVQRLAREGKSWPVLPWLRETLDAFKKTLPLVNDLRNEAMRPRHWQQLRDHMNARCDLRCAAADLLACHLCLPFMLGCGCVCVCVCVCVFWGGS